MVLHRLLIGSLFVFLFVLGLAPTAGAGHIHTTGEWFNGLVDGNDNDYSVHPENNNQNGHSHLNIVGVWISMSSTTADQLHRRECSCQHNHFWWDTSPRVECRHASHNESLGNHALNFHFHKHHNYCGSYPFT